MKPGDRVGRYELETLLGEGGMGRIFVARDRLLGRRIALKVLHTGPRDEKLAARLLREARMAARFQHPHAVTVYDVGEHEGQPWIAMELVTGSSLRPFLGNPSVPMDERLRWAVQIARTLAAAHREGIIHRDVKPDNIMIRDDGTIKLVDFGIARSSEWSDDPGDAPLTDHGVTIGSKGYAPLEQLLGRHVDGRSDQFAWAVTTYEIISGIKPWPARDFNSAVVDVMSGQVPRMRERLKVAALLRGLPPPGPEFLADVPCGVEDVLIRALAREPDSRYPTLDDAADALEACLEGKEVVPTAPRPRLTSAPTPVSSRSPSNPEATTSRLNILPTKLSPKPVPERPQPLSLRIEQAPPWTSPRARLRMYAKRGLAVIAVLGALGMAWHQQRPQAPSFVTVLRPTPAPTPVHLSAIGCQDAKIHGPQLASGLAHAVGIGACARLAVQAGVEWAVADAPHTLGVEATIAGDRAEVTLRLAGIELTGRGVSILDALHGVVPVFASRLQPPPLPEATLKAWGVDNEAAARRLIRAWRSINLGSTPSTYDKVARDLVATTPESPWSYMFFMRHLPIDSPEQVEIRKRTLGMLDRLPKPQALAIEAMMERMQYQGNPDQARQLAADAYRLAGSDPLVALVYLLCLDISRADLQGTRDALVERAFSIHPTQSLLLLDFATAFAVNTGRAAEGRKYAEQLQRILPESATWSSVFGEMAAASRHDEARQALHLAEQLGLTRDLAQRGEYAGRWAALELEQLAPQAARERAEPMLGDPSPQVVETGFGILIDALEMEGKLIDRRTMVARLREQLRQRGQAVERQFWGMNELGLRRWMGAPSLTNEERADAETVLAALQNKYERLVGFRVELALAQAGKKVTEKKALTSLTTELTALEQLIAKQSGEDRERRDSLLMQTLPLARAVRGDVACIDMWRNLNRASAAARLGVAYDAGLCLEASGDLAAAEKAYLLAREEGSRFERVAAMLRLSRIYRKTDRQREAEELEAIVNRLWAHADPHVRESVLNTR